MHIAVVAASRPDKHRPKPGEIRRWEKRSEAYDARRGDFIAR